MIDILIFKGEFDAEDSCKSFKSTYNNEKKILSLKETAISTDNDIMVREIYTYLV